MTATHGPKDRQVSSEPDEAAPGRVWPDDASSGTASSGPAPSGPAPVAAAPHAPATASGTERLPDADPNADHDGVIDNLEQELSVLWRRARAGSHRLAREVHPDMEPSAYGLMVLLHQQGPMRLTELAAAVGVGKPSLSRQVSLLQGLGLVEKHTDPVDGRAQPINLTEVGAARLEGAAAARKEQSRRTWTGWETEDLQSLVRLLHKLNTTARPPEDLRTARQQPDVPQDGEH